MRLDNLKTFIAQTIIRRIIYVLIGLIVTSFIGHCAHAETVPANIILYTNTDVGSCSATTDIAACTCVAGKYGGTVVSITPSTYKRSVCTVTRPPSPNATALLAFTYGCGTGGTLTDTGSSYTCTYATTCPTGQTRQSDGSCKADCAAINGTAAASGYFPYGTNRDGAFPNSTCGSNGCLLSFSGSVGDSRSLVNGTYVYYAQGTYTNTSFSCTYNATTSPQPTGTASPAPDTCATGQVQGTVNGKSVCITQSTGQVNNPNAPVTASTSTKNPEVTNADGSKTQTTTQTNADGSKTTTTVNTSSGGVVTTTISQTAPTIASTGTGTGTGTGSSTDPQKSDICTANPNIPACKDPDSGSAHATNDLYSKDDNRKSFDDVFSKFSDDIKGTPAYTGATSFFAQSIPAGSCGGMSGNWEVFGVTFAVNLDDIFCSTTAQTMYSYLSIGIKIAATWLAFSIAFL